MKRSIWKLGLFAVLSVPSAQAANVEINAYFRPDSSQPNKNVFINQTPSSGYCADYPGECAENSMFSIRLPVRFNPNRGLMPGEGVPIKAPANWRQLTVTNLDTQETEIVEVRITGIGSYYVLSVPATELAGGASNLEGHQKLWTTSSWVYASSPCLYSGVGAYSDRTYRFFWKTPVEAACVKTSNFYIPSMGFDTLDFAYELRTPNPLGMSSGRYTGSMLYTIGPAGDFSFGSVMNPDDSNLTLDFALDVQHTLKVEVPPGGEKIQLVPVGGWQSWLQAGRRPVRLMRDQTFNISASTRFKMQLECEFSGFHDCMLNDSAARRSVELLVYVSLPNGLTDELNQPVKRRRLRTAETQQFKPGIYVNRAPGILHFEVASNQMAFMIQPGTASAYRGNVTVIWDSEI